jgi:hypothetical protein
MVSLHYFAPVSDLSLTSISETLLRMLCLRPCMAIVARNLIASTLEICALDDICGCFPWHRIDGFGPSRSGLFGVASQILAFRKGALYLGYLTVAGEYR